MTTLTKKQINWLDKCSKGRWTLNPKTGLVDVGGTFNCSEQKLKDFKDVKFGVVGGHFYCDNNSLTSLVGAPQEVGGSFSCEYNRLISLDGAPQLVYWSFKCSYNRLTSLVGAPQKVNGFFNCSGNQLTSLVGAPQRVDVDFNCSGNQLTSLVGAPQKVGGRIDCSYNSLTSLEGTPQSVGGYFDCSRNPVAKETLDAIFDKMMNGYSFVIAAASLRNKMSERSWKLISPHIPDAIRPGVSMLGRFGVFK